MTEDEMVTALEEIDRNTLRYSRLEFDYGWVWKPADYELRMSCERAGQTYRLVDELAGPQSPSMAGVR